MVLRLPTNADLDEVAAGLARRRGSEEGFFLIHLCKNYGTATARAGKGVTKES